MIGVIQKFKEGPPEVFEAGQFLVYENETTELVGLGVPVGVKAGYDIVRHCTLIAPHELQWLDHMANRLGYGK
ncbi:hypothetical protein D3C77_301370 [compost metagenome]